MYTYIYIYILAVVHESVEAKFAAQGDLVEDRIAKAQRGLPYDLVRRDELSDEIGLLSKYVGNSISQEWTRLPRKSPTT